MRRSVAYACAGGLLSAGAPVGLLAIRWLQRSGNAGAALRQILRDAAADRAGYLYIGGSTALVLALFGYLLGREVDRLVALAETDPLTGLANARGLLGRLDAETARARRYRQPLSLLLVDLDGLKRINDRHGHAAGDEAIRGLARVIRSELRDSDTGARWGGDEFAILAPNTPETAALALAERIRALVPRQRAREPLTASLGVATLQPDEGGDRMDGAGLMRQADVAMYEAKRRGRNTVAAVPRG